MDTAGTNVDHSLIKLYCSSHFLMHFNCCYSQISEFLCSTLVRLFEWEIWEDLGQGKKKTALMLKMRLAQKLNVTLPCNLLTLSAA